MVALSNIYLQVVKVWLPEQFKICHGMITKTKEFKTVKILNYLWESPNHRPLGFNLIIFFITRTTRLLRQKDRSQLQFNSHSLSYLFSARPHTMRDFCLYSLQQIKCFSKLNSSEFSFIPSDLNYKIFLSFFL